MSSLTAATCRVRSTAAAAGGHSAHSAAVVRIAGRGPPGPRGDDPERGRRRAPPAAALGSPAAERTVSARGAYAGLALPHDAAAEYLDRLPGCAGCDVVRLVAQPAAQHG